jgi:anthranilate synthase
VIMGIEHKTLPIAAVQFHPESIMTLGHGSGQRLVSNVVANLS